MLRICNICFINNLLKKSLPLQNKVKDSNEIVVKQLIEILLLILFDLILEQHSDIYVTPFFSKKVSCIL